MIERPIGYLKYYSKYKKTYAGTVGDHLCRKVFKTATMAKKYAEQVFERYTKLLKAQANLRNKDE